jgi:hypothetical protein
MPFYFHIGLCSKKLTQNLNTVHQLFSCHFEVSLGLLPENQGNIHYRGTRIAKLMKTAWFS